MKENKLLAVELKSSILIEKTAKIKQLENGVKANLYGIAAILSDVDKNGYYKDDGFKSVVEYAGKVFGYKKTMIYNMLQVAENYIASGENKTIFASGDKDFSMGQVQELLALPPAKSKELVKSGKITPEMTSKEIRQVVKENKPQKVTKDKTATATKGNTAENPAKENKHVKKIIRIIAEIKTLVNSIEGEQNTERRMSIIGNLELLKKEIGLK